jgi:mannose-6-phosphate isomerase-like protein (cupin superfamily)
MRDVHARGAEPDARHGSGEHHGAARLRVIRLGDGAAQRCGPGTIVRIPPGLEHEVLNVGAGTLRLVVIYSPPLPKRDEHPMP